MVVQQGRLAEKSKLSAEQMLSAVRFGADKVFRPGASGCDELTMADVDAIIARRQWRLRILVGV